MRRTRCLVAALVLWLAGCGGSAEAGPAQMLIGSANQAASGTATITWVAPTIDVPSIGGQGGSAISDLAGFKVYTSTTSRMGPWSLAATVANPATLTASLTTLASGTWYLCVSSYDTAGNEGECSYAGAALIP